MGVKTEGESGMKAEHDKQENEEQYHKSGGMRTIPVESVSFIVVTTGDLRIFGVLLQSEPFLPYCIGVFNCGLHTCLYETTLLRSCETERRELPTT